jgi:hypothetical protein
MHYFITLLMVSAAAFAQTGTPFIPQPPLIQLKEFLQLSDSQYSMLFQNMAQHQRTVSERQLRMSTVQREIGEETARENPNPTELGTRYAEIEFICRAINDDAKQLAERNRAMLTDPQKTRLKALEDALKLFPTISQAQQVLLLDGSPGYAGAILGPTGGITSGLVFTSGCSVRTVPTALTRIGMFAPTP